jgi:hypothetical protein
MLISPRRGYPSYWSFSAGGIDRGRADHLWHRRRVRTARSATGYSAASASNSRRSTWRAKSFWRSLLSGFGPMCSRYGYDPHPAKAKKSLEGPSGRRFAPTSKQLQGGQGQNAGTQKYVFSRAARDKCWAWRPRARHLGDDADWLCGPRIKAAARRPLCLRFTLVAIGSFLPASQGNRPGVGTVSWRLRAAPDRSRPREDRAVFAAQARIACIGGPAPRTLIFRTYNISTPGFADFASVTIGGTGGIQRWNSR